MAMCRDAVAGDLGMMQPSTQSAFFTAPVWRGPMLKVLLSHHEAVVDLTSGPGTAEASAKRSPAGPEVSRPNQATILVAQTDIERLKT